MEKRENFQFRILYFLGIIFIVAGHSGDGGIALSYWFPFYSFHLGLFIFCSGYMFNNEKSFKDFIKNKLKRLIIPLYIWNLIYGVIVNFLRLFGFKYGYAITIKTLLIMPLYDGHQFVLNLGSWFIIPLFFTQLISYLYTKFIHKNYNSYMLFLVYLVLGMIGINLSMNGYNKSYWLLIDRLLYFLPFFGLGILYKEKLEKKDNLNDILYFLILVTLQLFLMYINDGAKSYTASWCNDFDSIYMPFILGFTGIAFWLRISKIILPILENNKLVKKIGTCTFDIMMHHLLGFFLLNTFWYCVQKISNIGFDIVSYKENIFYLFLPKGIDQFKIIYLIVGIYFSLFMSYLSKKFILKISKLFQKK